jgi:hypothetical protein
MMWRLLGLDDNKLTRRFGRRALLLIVGGLAWLGIGASSMLAPPIARFSGGSDGKIDQALAYFDSPAIGIIWVIGGVVALTVGTFHHRLPDPVGFNALLTPPLIWTVMFLFSTLARFAGEGHPRAPVSLIVWTLVTLFILVIAGWPDPVTPPEEPRR